MGLLSSPHPTNWNLAFFVGQNNKGFTSNSSELQIFPRQVALLASDCNSGYF